MLVIIILGTKTISREYYRKKLAQVKVPKAKTKGVNVIN